MSYSLSVSLFFIICGHSAIMVSLKAVTNTSTQWDTSWQTKQITHHHSETLRWNISKLQPSATTTVTSRLFIDS